MLPVQIPIPRARIMRPRVNGVGRQPHPFVYVQTPTPLPAPGTAVIRREANAIKRAEPITVVIGNPPYKEKAKGKGGWIEAGSINTNAPLNRWMPPPQWGVSTHAKHLRNLYVYFWRWATWKVFGDGPAAPHAAKDRKGIVCFITVAGFLNGPGFEAMRDYLRRTVDEIWVINCSPEGHQPVVNTRIFQGVQHQVCIVLAARMGRNDADKPARVRFRSFPPGLREDKFVALAALTLDGDGWADCLSDWRAPFLPAATGGWATYNTMAPVSCRVEPGLLRPTDSRCRRVGKGSSVRPMQPAKKCYSIRTARPAIWETGTLESCFQRDCAAMSTAQCQLARIRETSFHQLDTVSVPLTDNGSFRISGS